MKLWRRITIISNVLNTKELYSHTVFRGRSWVFIKTFSSIPDCLFPKRCQWCEFFPYLLQPFHIEVDWEEPLPLHWNCKITASPCLYHWRSNGFFFRWKNTNCYNWPKISIFQIAIFIVILSKMTGLCYLSLSIFHIWLWPFSMASWTVKWSLIGIVLMRDRVCFGSKPSPTGVEPFLSIVEILFLHRSWIRNRLAAIHVCPVRILLPLFLQYWQKDLHLQIQ